MRNRFGRVVLASLLTFVGGCRAWVGTQPIVKIGLVAPFEGLYRPLGYQVLPAVKLALRERNQSGGVHGYMVELVALNDGQDPGMAVERAREMVADPDVMGVVGHFDEQTTLAALPTYREAGLATVVPSGAPVEATADAYHQTLFLAASNDQVSQAAARYAVDDLGARHLAVIRGRDDLAEPFSSAVREQGASIVLDLDAEEESLLARLATERPDLIFFAGDALQAAELLLKLQEAGLEVPLLGGNGLNSPYLVQVAGAAAEGTTYVSVTPPVEDEGFIEGYMDLCGAPPEPYAALAYDATRVLLNALERAIAMEGKPRRDLVVAALAQGDGYEGLTGSISFDERGRRRNTQVYVYEIVGGRYPGELRK